MEDADNPLRVRRVCSDCEVNERLSSAALRNPAGTAIPGTFPPQLQPGIRAWECEWHVRRHVCCHGRDVRHAVKRIFYRTFLSPGARLTADSATPIRSAG